MVRRASTEAKTASGMDESRSASATTEHWIGAISNARSKWKLSALRPVLILCAGLVRQPGELPVRRGASSVTRVAKGDWPVQPHPST